ncbi:MAG: alpha/beta hydrolase [Minwuia sp.]|nr:alpha/beta hydrolase [Minwuia sp.]
MTREPSSDDTPELVRIRTHDGLSLVADRYGAPDGQPVIFMHGGGQTRHSWGGTAAAMARRGCSAFTCDHRGHGDSDWSPDQAYAFDDNASDLRAWAASMPRPPVVIGASLGGIAGMLALGHAPQVKARALVLVDIAPLMQQSGTDRIIAFMRRNMVSGFATLEEAAEEVRAYTPERKRAVDLNSIRKNLRHRDGRWYWHWDPACLKDEDIEDMTSLHDRLCAGVQAADCPILLVRGRHSDVASPASAEHLLSLRPDAVCVDVSGAGHMVAGDRNDIFTDAVLDFLQNHVPLTQVA